MKSQDIMKPTILDFAIIKLSVIVRENWAGPNDRGRPFTFIFSQYKSYPKRLTTMISVEVGVRSFFLRDITTSGFLPFKLFKMAEISSNFR